MTTPGWILGIFAVIMLGVAAVSAARLVTDRPWRRGVSDADIDTAHLLMGVAMAGMLVASLATLPNGAWTVIFAVMTAWFGRRVYRESRGQGARALVNGHHAPHLVHSAAMVYMFAAVSTPMVGHGAGMSGMGASGTAMQTLSAPVVGFVFALLLAGYVVMDLDRLSRPASDGYFLAVAASSTPAAAAAAVRGPVNTAIASSSGPAMVEGSVATAPERAPSSGEPADGSAAGSARRVLLDPRTAAGCRIAMGVTMAFMLILMI